MQLKNVLVFICDRVGHDVIAVAFKLLDKEKVYEMHLLFLKYYLILLHI